MTAADFSRVAVTLRPATLEDSRHVWEWRNEETTRLASFSSEPIPFEHHQGWFASQLQRPDSRMLIAVDERGEPIGVVRFDWVDGEPEVSVALATENRGKGYGPRLLAEACSRIFQETSATHIVALVRQDNHASMSAFRRAGFAHQSALDVNGIHSWRLVLERSLP